VGAGRKFILLFVRAKWVFNIWKLPVNGAEKATPQQVTHLEKNPIRFLSVAQNGDLCFGYDGEIYVLPHGATEPAKVKIRIAVAGNAPDRQQTHLNDGVTEIVVSPNGKEIAFVVRGDVYVASIEHGDTKRITNTPAKSASQFQLRRTETDFRSGVR